MAYDRSGLTILPNFAATAAAGDAAFDLDPAINPAGNEAPIAMTMQAAGVVWGVVYDVAEVVASDTTNAVLAVHVDDVEVGTFTVADAEAAGDRYFKKITAAANQTLAFRSGQVLKVEVKTAAADAGTETGQIRIMPVVVLDQA